MLGHVSWSSDSADSLPCQLPYIIQTKHSVDSWLIGSDCWSLTVHPQEIVDKVYAYVEKRKDECWSGL